MSKRYTSFAFFALMISPALGYEIETHKEIAKHAASQSVLAGPTTLRLLGLNYAIADPQQQFPNSNGQLGAILSLLQDGAHFEDGFTCHDDRPRHHFFDPQHLGRGFQWGVVTGMPSPDWALEDTQPANGQSYSYKRAREFFAKAFTSPAEADRKKNFGLLFQSLGMITHHLQDMAQPQHVRNDAHYFAPPGCGIVTLGGKLLPQNKSRYEEYTDLVRDRLNYDGYAPVYSPTERTNFNSPRHFWATGDGKGIAEFTGKNFVSAGTNFGWLNGQVLPNSTFQFPVPGPAGLLVDVAQAYAEAGLGPVPAQIQEFCGNNCKIEFYSTTIADPLGRNNPSSMPDSNARASSLSIFDQDLQLGASPITITDPNTGAAYQTKLVFALNNLNFVAAQKQLIPRAVAYSAGLINYFFRGQMEINLPDDGIYSIVDHGLFAPGQTNHPTNALSGFKGFDKIKLRLKNTTGPIPPPGGATANTQDMPNGTLVAVVKFHRNKCYTDDLDGELTSTAQLGTCRSETEEIVVSANAVDGQGQPVNAVPFASAANPNGIELTFNFPTQQIPINAWDVLLQVVYRGRLGSEDDAVVVTTRDIAEPTYYQEFSLRDCQGSVVTIPQVCNYDSNTGYNHMNLPKLVRATASWTSVAQGVAIVPPVPLLSSGQFLRVAMLVDRASSVDTFMVGNSWDAASLTTVYPLASVDAYHVQSPDAIDLYGGKFRTINVRSGPDYLFNNASVFTDPNTGPYHVIAFDQGYFFAQNELPSGLGWDGDREWAKQLPQPPSRYPTPVVLKHWTSGAAGPCHDAPEEFFCLQNLVIQ